MKTEELLQLQPGDLIYIVNPNEQGDPQLNIVETVSSVDGGYIEVEGFTDHWPTDWIQPVPLKNSILEILGFGKVYECYERNIQGVAMSFENDSAHTCILNIEIKDVRRSIPLDIILHVHTLQHIMRAVGISEKFVRIDPNELA